MSVFPIIKQRHERIEALLKSTPGIHLGPMDADSAHADRAHLIGEVGRLEAALRATVGGIIRYAGYQCADCGMQVLEGRSVCTATGRQHTTPKGALGQTDPVNEAHRLLLGIKKSIAACEACGGKGYEVQDDGHGDIDKDPCNTCWDLRELVQDRTDYTLTLAQPVRTPCPDWCVLDKGHEGGHDDGIPF